MLIALESDILTNGSRPTGFGVYLANLIRSLDACVPSDYEFLLLHAREKWSGGDFGNRFRPVSYHFTGSQFAAIALNLSRVLKREKADLFHATCTTGVPPFKLDIPVVTTVHDLYCNTIVMKLLYSWMLKNTDAFICNSAVTKRESRLDRASVIYPGVQLEEVEPARQSGVGSPYFLCVGAIEPRKGQLDLARAYVEALKRDPSLPDMLFVGPVREGGAELDSLMMSCPKIRRIGFVSPEVLAALYRDAVLFIMPSRAEGFGIPLVESMLLGVPSVCSDIPVFHETADGTAYFTSDFISALLEYRSIISGFDRAGAHERAKMFSWRVNALRTLEIYSSVL